MLCMLIRVHSLSYVERWCQQINVHGTFLFQCMFPVQCTLKLITLALQRAISAPLQDTLRHLRCWDFAFKRWDSASHELRFGFSRTVTCILIFVSISLSGIGD